MLQSEADMRQARSQYITDWAGISNQAGHYEAELQSLRAGASTITCT